MKSKLPILIVSLLLVVCVGVSFVLINDQSKKMTSIQDNENVLKSEIKRLESEIETSNSDIENKETMIAELNGQIETLNANITDLEKNVEGVQETLENTQATLDYELSLKEKWSAYMSPEDIIGEWAVVNLVDEESDFNANAPKESNWLKKIKFESETAMFDTGEGYWGAMTWVDDHIMSGDVAFGFRIEEMSGQDYLFLEWKSGDYLNGMTIGYYVLERIN